MNREKSYGKPEKHKIFHGKPETDPLNNPPSSLRSGERAEKMDSFYLTNFPVVFAENLTKNLFSNETRNIYLYKYGSFLLFNYLVVEKMTKLCEISGKHVA